MNVNWAIKLGKTLGKTAVNYAGPISSGVLAVLEAVESKKQKQTIAELVAKVAELESKIK